MSSRASLLNLTLLLLPLPFTSASTLQPQNLTTDQPSNPELTLPTQNLNISFPSYNLSTTDLLGHQPLCLATLGQNIDWVSCLLAAGYLEEYFQTIFKESVSVGQKGQGSWDIGSPMYFVNSKQSRELTSSMSYFKDGW